MVNPAQRAQTGQAVQTEQVAESLNLAESGGSYYVTLPMQKSAGGGVETHKVDKALANTILQCAKTGGRISQAEMASDILGAIKDGGKYGEGEKQLTRLLLAACDDRKTVELNGQRLRITGPAEEVIQKELPKFWGSLRKDPVDMTPLQDGVEMKQQNKFI